MRATFIISCIGAIFSTVSMGEISLLSETTPPDPNEEITVWIHTDEPLFCMDIGVYVTGDASITDAMSEADCNDFGWDNGWRSDPYIDPNGWVSIGSVRWASDANDIVGYLKFRYYSGQVAVYIDQEYSTASIWNGNSVTYSTFSTEALLFGEMVLPPLREPNVPTPILIQCPLGSGGPTRGEPNSFPEWSQQFEMLSMLDSEPVVIEINSDITTNQVWDANNVYYVTEPNGINIQALLVIEPGTTVIFGYGCGLFVNSGGVLISRGTPDKPILFTPDWVYYDYPESIGYYWQVFPSYGPHYFCPIYMESTASPASTVRYCMVEGSVAGIVTNNIRLDNPIENNYLLGNVWGIYEFGPKLTDIHNNLCFFADQAAIEVELCPDPNDVPDTETIFTIEQNTCDAYQYCGITVHGAGEPNEVPTVHLLNNIVSGSYWYGLNIGGGPMWLLIVNTGYYNNSYNKNWEFDEYNPVYAETNPYYPYIGEKSYQHHYLDGDSVFVDAGAQYIEQTKLIGMTTNFDSLPDKDLVDLGFHSMDWNYIGGEGIAGTDIDDVVEIANYWLTYTPYDPNSPNYQDPNIVDPNTISYGGDWNDDGFVDLADFAILSGMWQKTQEAVAISFFFDKEPNNVGGTLTISADLVSSNIYEAWLFMDGEIVSGLNAMDEGLSETIVKTNQYRNGTHEFKIVGLCDDQFVFSSPAACRFNNELSSITQPKGFEPNEPYYLYALCDLNDVYSVELYDIVNDQTTFSTECQNGLAVCIPHTAFPEEYGIYDLTITKQEEGDMLLLSGGESLSVDEKVGIVISRKFDRSDPRNPYYRMVISIGDKKLQSAKEQCWKAVVRAAVTKNIYPILLKYEDCTWDNLKFCLRLNNVKMWYHLSHGNHDLLGQPPRQCITTASGLVFSYLKKDYGPNVPPDYQKLWWFYENNPSLAELGFQGSSKMTWVQINACYSARTTEFPRMLGILPINDPIGKQVFVGWKNSALVYDVIGKYNQFEEDYWSELTPGNSLRDAVMDSLPPGGGTNILENFMYYGVIDWQYAHFRYPNIN